MSANAKTWQRKDKRHKRPGLAKDAGAPHALAPARLNRQVAFKAVIDFALALVLFALTSPVLVVLAMLVKVTSRGPAIYRQTRVGRHGKLFTIYKLRTMAHECERLSGVRWSPPGDSRVTLLGRVLRKTHLDELPQLWNVLRGDMSLVGPRPERPEFVPDLQTAIPHYADRLLVRPGVTGLAQVQLPADTDLGSVRRKLAYDLYYIRHWSLALDVKLMLCTGFKLLSIPFRVAGTLLRVPSREYVQPVYPELLADAN
jgi:lipopolysaccharide/colanic/teichoic acid biosynthesis glycosyltransferase